MSFVPCASSALSPPHIPAPPILHMALFGIFQPARRTETPRGNNPTTTQLDNNSQI